MGKPANPVTLTPDEIEALNKQLAFMRHEINNHLSLIVAASELLKFKPEMRERMAVTLGEQPPKIIRELAQFSADFERALGIPKD